MERSVLEAESDYYRQHQAELLRAHTGKYLVIKNKQVWGVYETRTRAYDEARDKFKPGTFLIQFCSPDADSPRAA